MYFLDERIHQYDSSQLYENRLKLYEELIDEWNYLSTDQKATFTRQVDFDKKAEIDKLKKYLSEHSQSRSSQMSQEIPKSNSQQEINEKSANKNVTKFKDGSQISEEQKDGSFSEGKKSSLANNRPSRPKESLISQYFEPPKPAASKQAKSKMKTKFQKRALSSTKQNRLQQIKKENPNPDDPFCDLNQDHDNNAIISTLQEMEKMDNEID